MVMRLQLLPINDSNGKKTKQIDLQKEHKWIEPYTRHGYENKKKWK